MYYALISLSLAFLPMLFKHGQNLWRSPQYQFFPLLIGGIVLILMDRGFRLSDVKETIPRMGWPQLGLIISGLALLLLAVLFETPNASMIALMMVTGAFVWFWSRNSNQSLWGPWALGWLLVRLHRTMEGKLTSSLQLSSSQLSSRLLDWTGINHLMTGNVLHLDGQDLFVDEACSGVVSLFSILAFGAMFAVYQRYVLLRACLLMLIGVACTVFLNVLRISIIAMADQWYDYDLAHGTPHTLLGVALFLVTLGVFYCADQVLGLFLKPIPASTIERRRLNSLERWWNWLTTESDGQEPTIQRPIQEPLVRGNPLRWSFVAVVTFSLAIFGIWTTRQIALSTIDFSEINSAEIAKAVGEDFLSGTGATAVKYEKIERERRDPDGEFSKIFYVESDYDYQLSIDYPFYLQWHDLTECYIATGWKVRGRRIVNGNDSNYMEVDLTDDNGQSAFLAFSLVYSDGQPVETHDRSKLVSGTLAELKRRMTVGFTEESIQFQLWYSSQTEIAEETKTELRKRFLEFRKLAREKMFPNFSANR